MNIRYEFLSAPGQLRADDLPAILALLEQLHDRPCQVARQHLEALLQNSRLLVVRDVEAGEKIVGMACLALYLTPTGRMGRIEDVVVEHTYRGQGLGIQLTSRLLEEAHQLGLPGVSLSSNPRRLAANHLYQKMGFQRVETNVYYKKL